MGGQVSQISGTSTVGIEAFISELKDIEYEKTISTTRFLKTIVGLHKEGLLIVKIYIKPNNSEINLNVIEDLLIKENINLKNNLEKNKNLNILPYGKIIQTDIAGYLVRQYVNHNLYDRISTRPFLNDIEKKWIVFQLLACLKDCHESKIYHGDIKSENILLTSYNWVYLTDFSSVFKPIYLPEDDPSKFLFFFNTSLRNTCYIAPERFFNSNFKNFSTTLTPEMDIFSLGCVIAELFLDGESIFSLSQLFDYKKGKYYPNLENINDVNIRNLIKDMISLDPNKRFSIDYYLSTYKSTCFPGYFYSFLHQYVGNITGPLINIDPFLYDKSNLISNYFPSDERINSIFNDYDKISYFLGFDSSLTTNSSLSNIKTPLPVIIDILNCEKKLTKLYKPSNKDNESALIFLTIILSSLRSTTNSATRIKACDLILSLAEKLPDDIKLDRCLPYLVFLLKDENPSVVIASLRTIAQLLELIQVINPVNGQLMTVYLLPNLSHLESSTNLLIRVHYSFCLASLANSSLKFLSLSQNFKSEGSLSFSTTLDFQTSIENTNFYNTLYERSLQKIINIFKAKILKLMTDQESIVKRALLNSIDSLSLFFGRDNMNELLLSNLITYLNDKDPLLRAAFFEIIPSITTFIGEVSFDEYILPLMIQSLADTSEIVIEKILSSLSTIAELGMIKTTRLWDLLPIVLTFSALPNIWIRQNVFAFVSSSTKWLNLADLYCMIPPIVRPYLECDVDSYDLVSLLECAQIPISRLSLNMTILWAQRSDKSLFWNTARDPQMLNLSKSILNSRYLSINNNLYSLLSNDNVKFSKEDEEWLDKLKSTGFNPKDIWKLTVLREYIWRISRANNTKYNPVETFTSASLQADGITPINVFFEENTSAFENLTENLILSTFSLKNSGDKSLTNKKVENDLNELENSKPSLLIPNNTSSIENEETKSINDTTVSGSIRPLINEGASGDKKIIGNSIENESLTNNNKNLLAPIDIKNLNNVNNEILANFSHSSSIHGRLGSSPVSIITKQKFSPKASPETATNDIDVYGEVEFPEGDFLTKSTNRFEHDSSSNTKKDTTLNTPISKSVNSYNGDDPHIIKFLDTTYNANFFEDLAEFGPTVTSIKFENYPIPSQIHKSFSNSQKLVNTETKKWKPKGIFIAHFCEHKAAINRIIISPDHLFFLTASDDGTIKLWGSEGLEKNMVNRSRQTYFHSENSKVKSICFIQNKHCFASASTDGQIHLVRINIIDSKSNNFTTKFGKMQLVRSYTLLNGEYATWMEHVIIEYRSILLVATSHSRIIALNLKLMSPIYVLQNPLSHGPITCFCLDRKLCWMVVGTTRGILDLWDLRFQLRLRAWGIGGLYPIYRLAVHPLKSRGLWIVISGGANENEISVWDIEKLVCRQIFCTESGLTESSDNKYQVWKVDEDDSNKLFEKLTLHDEEMMKTLKDQDSNIETNKSNVDKRRNNMLGNSNDKTDGENEVDNSGMGIRAFSVGNLSSISSGLSSGNSETTRQSPYLISGGKDFKVRFWDLERIDNSCVVNGLGPNEPQRVYSTSYSSSFVKIFEKSNNLNSKDMKGRKGKYTKHKSGRPTRVSIITQEQQSLMHNHLDMVSDVALLRRPYNMVLSVDRSGVIKVYS